MRPADRLASNMTPMRESSSYGPRTAALTARLPNTLEGAFNDTVKNLGLPYATDLTCGNPAGAAPIANTRAGNTRIDACKWDVRVRGNITLMCPDRGYLYGKSRPNLTSRSRWELTSR
jgi:hypothetical protein